VPPSESAEVSQPVPQRVALTVIAQDPSVRAVPPEGGAERILVEQIRIPAEHLDPGPRGARLYVVDYDSGTGRLRKPARIKADGKDRFAKADDHKLLSSTDFRAQNVYAIAASTLAAAEAALGRRLCWGFPGHQLYLVPHAFPEENAYYSPDDGAIFFGYVPGDGGEVQTSLSHDVVAHETTHAILDGLRPRFNEPGLPDQLAFHEALADCVALLSVFSLEKVVARLLDKGGFEERVPKKKLTEESLQETALFAVAEELGRGGGHSGGLRRSVELEPDPKLLEQRKYEEPHTRGEVWVAAVMRTLLSMWAGRLPAITEKTADRKRVVEEGAKAADHLLRMLLRGIDYMPPVELEFADALEAVLVADAVVAPDDEHGYREALEGNFAAYGIKRPKPGIVDLATGPAPVYERMNYAVLRSDKDEVERFLWENAEVFDFDRTWQTTVEGVRPSIRFGPDGLLVSEVIAHYVQRLQLTAAEAKQKGVAVPAGVPRDMQLRLWGGGVIVFDQFGRAKLHHAKPLTDWGRQSRRLAYLWSHGLTDTKNRLGFTISAHRGQRFAALHVGSEYAGEEW
jgi:hypothetical protein